MPREIPEMRRDYAEGVEMQRERLKLGIPADFLPPVPMHKCEVATCIQVQPQRRHVRLRHQSRQRALRFQLKMPACKARVDCDIGRCTFDLRRNHIQRSQPMIPSD